MKKFKPAAHSHHACEDGWVLEWNVDGWTQCYRVDDMMHAVFIKKQKKFAIQLARHSGKCLEDAEARMNSKRHHWDPDCGNVNVNIINPIKLRVSFKRRHLESGQPSLEDNVAKCRDDQMLGAGQQIDIDAYVR